MGSLADAIRLTLDGPEVNLDSVDLHQVAAILKPLFPEHSLPELAKRVAEVAIGQGCRHLVWNPPQREDADRAQ